MNNTKCIKYIKDECRKYGLVFKKSNYSNLYLFSDRKNKGVVLSNLTLNAALNNIESGYISCYDKEKQDFNKDQLKNLGLIY